MNFKLFKNFASLKLAISLLFIIAFFSIIGTVIEQGQSIEFYKVNYPNSLNWKIILTLGLDHVYRTWWYSSSLILLGVCLTSCTFFQQFPTLKIARICYFQSRPQQFKRQELNASLNQKSFFELLRFLQNTEHTIFQQNTKVYCYKGILGRFAPIIVHVSLLLILGGSMVAALGGFNGQELITKGEIFHIQNTNNISQFSTVPELPLRINDFWIEYTKDNQIKQFFSDLSVLSSQGNELKRKTISVNIPLRFQNLTIYQTDWDLIGIRCKIESTVYQLPLVPFTKAKNLWSSWIPYINNTGLFLVIKNLEGNFLLYNTSGEFINEGSLNELISLDKSLRIIETLAETGIQIKADPGLPIIYLGFGILMISTLISYISYNQVWVLALKNKILISAQTNRAQLNLQVLFLKFISLNKKSKSTP